MRNHRKTYIYGGVFVLALVAFLCDRALQPGPRDASAGEVQPKSSDKSAHPAATATLAQAKDAGKTPATTMPSPASSWLRELPEVPEVRDLFAVTNLFPAESDMAVGGQGKKSSDPVAEFVNVHHLNATFQDGRSGCAVVDGRVIRPGQGIDGFRLTGVESFRAVFRKGQHEAVLTMTATEQAANEVAADNK